jgi:VanZ family protein
MKRVLLATLRYPRAWMTLGLVIAVLIVIASLTPARDMPVLGISDKLEHAVAYLVLSFWFASLMPRRDYVYLSLALIAFGGGLEIAQGVMGWGREADLMDLVADGAGILAGVLLAATPLGRWAQLIEGYLAPRP